MCKSKKRGGRRCQGKNRTRYVAAENAVIDCPADNPDLYDALRLKRDAARHTLVEAERAKTKGPVVLNNLINVEDAHWDAIDGISVEATPRRVELSQAASERAGIFHADDPRATQDTRDTTAMDKAATLMRQVEAENRRLITQYGKAPTAGFLLHTPEGGSHYAVQPVTGEDGKLAGYRVLAPHEAEVKAGNYRSIHPALDLQTESVSISRACLGTFRGRLPELGDAVASVSPTFSSKGRAGDTALVAARDRDGKLRGLTVTLVKHEPGKKPELHVTTSGKPLGAQYDRNTAETKQFSVGHARGPRYDDQPGTSETPVKLSGKPVGTIVTGMSRHDWAASDYQLPEGTDPAKTIGHAYYLTADDEAKGTKRLRECPAGMEPERAVLAGAQIPFHATIRRAPQN